MLYFIIGLVILIVGGAVYGKVCENTFGPDDRSTPANAMRDGVDYVPMKLWKNALVELLNIAGTGPILGPILGILYGPIAFILIPVGNVLAGSMHDYFSGMISLRNKGAQMPLLIRKYLGARTKAFYNVVVTILMLLVGAVFTSIPGELFVSQILGQEAVISNPVLWIVYGVIFLYYFIATLFPIDAIIGRIYPIFGAFLVISAVGIFVGLLGRGGELTNIDWGNLPGQNQMLGKGFPIIPTFFVTVACGILSGFHATQATLISRTVEDEKEGRVTFFYMMLIEGFIAMVWAAGAMIIYNGLAKGAELPAATPMVGIISKEFLGKAGGMLAIIGVIVLPITSGDTALRSLRLMLGEQLKINQGDKGKRLALTLGIFIPTALILVFSKLNPNGFNVLWRYFAFTNQFIALFALSMIAVYLFIRDKNGWIALIPGMFYCFIVMSFILHAKIGFNFDKLLGNEASYTASYILAAIITVIYAFVTVNYAKKNGMAIEEIDALEFLKENK